MDESLGRNVVASVHSSHGQEQPQAAKKQSLLVLLLYMGAVIAVCLTAFNLYLLAWLWSSLGGGGGGGGGGNEQEGKLDLASSWSRVKFSGRLTSERPLRVHQMLGWEEKSKSFLEITSKNAVQILSAAQRKPNENGTTNSSHHLAPQEVALLQLSAEGAQINFPNGLVVLDPRFSNEPPALMCDPRAQCQLAAKRIRLTSPQGFHLAPESHLATPGRPWGPPGSGSDANWGSLQVSSLTTGRLHSAVGSLNLLAATGSSRLEARRGALELLALEQVVLFSRHSAVIMNAPSVDVSHVRGAQVSNKGGRGDYKLCVCLDPGRKRGGGVAENGPNPPEARAGLVFAISSGLVCAKFTRTVCNGPG